MKNPCFRNTKEELIKIFTLYATGSDSHIDSIKWLKLTSIEPGPADTAYFIFGKQE